MSASPPRRDAERAGHPERGDARDALGHLGRRLLVPALLAVAVLLGFALLADARELARAMAGFRLALLAPILTLSLVNYALRYARWELYLARLDVALERRDSVAVFLVGFVLSVTPGKAGELGKAWLARELGGGEARRTVAAVLAERVTDLAGVLLLVALGAPVFAGGAWIAAAALAAAALMLALLAWRRAARALLAVAGRLPGLRNLSEVLAEVYDRLRELLLPAPLAAAVALSTLAWGAEAAGFVIVARAYAPGFGALAGTFNYAASTLAGAVSLLPGGLVASEGVLTALLDAQGLSTAAAASATLWIRAATLWFAVALGLVALPWLAARLRSRGMVKDGG